MIESVVGVASEAKELRGVAASLLGPLIPSEVKDAEEKWRKRLIKGLDETESTADSEGEGARPAGSPSAPLQDSDTVPTTEKEPGTKKQLGDNSGNDEETEEDTVELELALERKKVCFPSMYRCEKNQILGDVTLILLHVHRLSFRHWRTVMEAQGAPVPVRRQAKRSLVLVVC